MSTLPKEVLKQKKGNVPVLNELFQQLFAKVDLFVEDPEKKYGFDGTDTIESLRGEYDELVGENKPVRISFKHKILEPNKKKLQSIAEELYNLTNSN